MSMHSRVLLVSASVLAVAAAGCSWGRFTKLKKDAPMVRLDAPDDYNGEFGTQLTIAETNDRSELFVAGSAFDRGGLVYSLGVSEDPQPNPTDEGHCESQDDCAAIFKPVGVNVNVASGSGEERELCFISGYGSVASEPGLWMRCDDNGQLVYFVPSALQAAFSEDFDGENPRRLQLATNRGSDQLIAASTPMQGLTEDQPDQGFAWYYEPTLGSPNEIATPADAASDFGGAVSVAKIDSGHLIAVAAPSAAELWIFRVEEETLSRVGCIQGSDKFGRTLAAGDVDGDGEDDFVVASEDAVTVYSGATIGDLDEASGGGDCEAQELSDTGQLMTLSCEENSDASRCNVSGFGDALAVADVDGDGEGEVFVGAPDMTVRDASKAGAALAFDGDGELLSIQIVSNAEDGDRFGASLSPVAQEGRDILAVGAPGSRNVYLLYCAAGTDGDGSARCQLPE